MSTPAFLQDFLTNERQVFGKVVGAVLPSGLDYRPDPKARSAREIIGHLIGHNQDMIELIDDGVIHHRNQVSFDSVDDGVALLDSTFADVIDKLGTIDEATWMSTSTFFAGDQAIMEAPRMQLAWVLFLDSIHHRGQLSTHLRPMGSSVPAIYGPSADEGMDEH